MLTRLKNWWSGFRLSLRVKMTLSLSAIAVVLLLSSIISMLEYRRMSNYVSTLIAEDIRNIHIAQDLLDAVDSYNMKVLAVIGDESVSSLPDFDRATFLSKCDSLKSSSVGISAAPMADSVLYAYSAYMLASTELVDVLQSTFIDTRDWYFGRLQPLYGRMRGYLDTLSGEMYQELQQNSEDFDSGLYRSIIPSSVAVLVGIILVFLLMFFILSDYVNPIYKMLEGLRNYRSYKHKYTYTFDGSDQLADLNAEISELTEESRQNRRRLAELRERNAEVLREFNQDSEK
jgi:predicted PurR-regulated permease PerM